MKKKIKLFGGLLAAVLFAAPCFAETSFRETTAYLQSGGEYYYFLSGNQIRLQLKSMPEIIKALKEVRNPDAKQAADVIARIIPVVMESGIMKLDGIGQSSLRQGTLYSNRVVLYSKNAKDSGYIWNCIQRKNRKFSILNRAPSNTVLLSQTRFDLGKLHAYLKSAFQKNDKELLDLMVQFETSMNESAVPLQQLYNSLGEEFTLIVAYTPEGGNPMIPFEFALIAETKNDFLFSLIKDKMKDDQTAQIQGNKILINTGFVVLEISSLPNALEIKSSGFRFADGKQVKSLAANPVFAKYARGLPDKGIGVFYLAPNVLAPLMNLPFLQGNPAAAACAKTPGNLMVYTIHDNGYAGYGNSDVSLVPNLISAIPSLIRLADSDTPRPAARRPVQRPVPRTK